MAHRSLQPVLVSQATSVMSLAVVNIWQMMQTYSSDRWCRLTPFCHCPFFSLPFPDLPLVNTAPALSVPYKQSYFPLAQSSFSPTLQIWKFLSVIIPNGIVQGLRPEYAVILEGGFPGCSWSKVHAEAEIAWLPVAVQSPQQETKLLQGGRREKNP